MSPDKSLTSTGVLEAAFFFVGAAAADADDHILYNEQTGGLLYDRDGSGAAGAVQFATLSGGLAITSADDLSRGLVFAMHLPNLVVSDPGQAIHSHVCLQLISQGLAQRV